jgi:hypothetical protein
MSTTAREQFEAFHPDLQGFQEEAYDNETLGHARGEEKQSDTETHEKEQERARRRVKLSTPEGVTYSLDLASLSQPGNLFYGLLHLPDGMELGTAYIENWGVATNLNVFEGVGGQGRIIAIVKKGGYKRVALASHITSISVVSLVADAGLVIVHLSSLKWSPTSGTL